MPIPENSLISRAISTSHFFEDVSSESLVFNRKGLEKARSTSHFFEDVPNETAEKGGTYPDKNGKRRFSELAFARAHGFAHNAERAHMRYRRAWPVYVPACMSMCARVFV